MGARGRVSSAALSVTASQVQTLSRPDAPYDLTDEETEVWWSVVNAMPADWFPVETHGLLTSYCRHVVRERRLAQLIGQAESATTLDVPEYERLLKMMARETQSLATLATRMRLSQQSSYDRKKTKAAKFTKPPWEG